jgi:antitoxin component YwqK of YwqJK toxin-antitoxin module
MGMRGKFFSTFLTFLPLLGFCGGLCCCTIEHAEEQIVEKHVNGSKKTSVWVYPDGEILKRNEWYDNGIKEFEIQYKNNVPHGKIKRWTVLGDVALDGEYKNGKRDGKWVSYFVDRLNTRRKEAVRYYKDDHPVGDWEGWHFNGNKAFEEHYDENGDTVGVWKKWYDNGVLAEENSCHQNHTNEPAPGYIKRYGRNCKILEYYECLMGYKQGEYKLYYESYGEPDLTGESCSNSKIREEGHVEGECGEDFSPITLYRADGSVIKKIEYIHVSDCGYDPSRVSWFDEKGVLLRETVFRNHTPNFGWDGVVYGLCEGSSNLFCAETSNVQYANPYGTLDSCTLSQKSAFTQSIGKYKANVRYIKPDHKLLYEEYWDIDSSSTASKLEGPILLVSRSFYPDSMGGGMASEGFWGNPNAKGESKRHGIWRNWYPNGILKDSLNYVNGERVGEQFGYDSTGKLTIHKTEAGKNRPVIMHIPGEK